MQQPQPVVENPSLAGPTFLYGGILGLIYGLVAILSRVLDGRPGITFILTLVSWIAGIVLLLVVGAVVASRGAGLGRSTLAGLLASVIAWAIDAVFFIVLHLVTPRFYSLQLEQTVRAAHAHLTAGAVRGVYIGELIVYLVLALAFGALLGVLGGLIGKTRYTPPAAPYQEAMYTGFGGQPPAGYPPAGYPPAGSPPAGFQSGETQPVQPGQWPQNPPPTPPAQ